MPEQRIDNLITLSKLNELLGKDITVLSIHSAYVPFDPDTQSELDRAGFYWKMIDYKARPEDPEALLCKIAELIAFDYAMHIRFTLRKGSKEFDYALTDSELTK